ncbi:hypothetical protein XFF6990_90203 [Xanthomonas citri pv. fuscans]|uniref:Uncharacterized protein n=1 Tax=Xanthomonas campestris pv. phaseoli TaxID=317013 RepID=A0A7Z7NFV9_XANCH|nr:hypothetical protein XFF6990_90203 [Xanthomonas citri pv. fuscans]SOO23217.1 hypothetical protein XFF6991_180328 [Xanthomonas phaseoli pv. phaseoli]
MGGLSEPGQCHVVGRAAKKVGAPTQRTTRRCADDSSQRFLDHVVFETTGPATSSAARSRSPGPSATWPWALAKAMYSFPDLSARDIRRSVNALPVLLVKLICQQCPSLAGRIVAASDPVSLRGESPSADAINQDTRTGRVSWWNPVCVPCERCPQPYALSASR